MSRIIAGRAKGRTLEAPKGQGTRPTSDRVREAVFAAFSSWLGTVDDDPARHLDGIAFLDLYAGSGAIGLEAASRGASRVTMVEKDAGTARVIQNNARTLELLVDIRLASVRTFLTSGPQPFDIVYLDPPYAIESTEVDEQVTMLQADGWLAPKALVVIERGRRTPPPVWGDFIVERWEKRYGDTVVHFGVTASAEEQA